MATQTNEIRIPAWVPESIRNPVFQTIKPKNETERKTLKRLLTHPKMKGVYKELTKHCRDSSYKTTDELVHKPADIAIGVRIVEDQMYTVKPDFNLALQNFFYAAYELAVDPANVVTRDELMREYEHFADIHRKLAEDAKLLRECFRRQGLHEVFNIWRTRNPDLKHFGLSGEISEKPLDPIDTVEQMEEVARFFDSRHVLGKFQPVPPFDHVVRFKPEGKRAVVKRHITAERARAYILGLANTCKKTFGSYLYGVVATVASVALEKTITDAYVKKAVKGQMP
jgi:hypothetical protein